MQHPLRRRWRWLFHFTFQFLILLPIILHHGAADAQSTSNTSKTVMTLNAMDQFPCLRQCLVDICSDADAGCICLKLANDGPLRDKLNGCSQQMCSGPEKSSSYPQVIAECVSDDFNKTQSVQTSDARNKTEGINTSVPLPASSSSTSSSAVLSSSSSPLNPASPTQPSKPSAVPVPSSSPTGASPDAGVGSDSKDKNHTSGKTSMGPDSTKEATTGTIPVGSGDPISATVASQYSRSRSITIGIAVSISVFILLLAAGLFIWRRRRVIAQRFSISTFMDHSEPEHGFSPGFTVKPQMQELFQPPPIAPPRALARAPALTDPSIQKPRCKSMMGKMYPLVYRGDDIPGRDPSYRYNKNLPSENTFPREKDYPRENKFPREKKGFPAEKEKDLPITPAVKKTVKNKDRVPAFPLPPPSVATAIARTTWTLSMISEQPENRNSVFRNSQHPAFRNAIRPSQHRTTHQSQGTPNNPRTYQRQSYRSSSFSRNSFHHPKRENADTQMEMRMAYEAPRKEMGGSRESVYSEWASPPPHPPPNHPPPPHPI